MTKIQKTYAYLALALIISSFSAYLALKTTKNNNDGEIACKNDKILSQKLNIKGEVAALKAENPRPLPALTFKNEAGEVVNMSIFKGKITLLNLWATWCVPCKAEMPALNALEKKLGDDKFAVIAVNIDTRNLERATDFLKDAKITHLKNYTDHSAKIFADLKSANFAFGMPTSLLIGREGCVIASLAGPAEWASDDAVNLINGVK